MPITSIQVDPAMKTTRTHDVERLALLVLRRIRVLSKAEKAELASLERRHHLPTTLEELVAWEREFGAESAAENERRNGHPASPAFKREQFKHYAREFGVSYATVKAAVEPARAEGAGGTGQAGETSSS